MTIKHTIVAIFCVALLLTIGSAIAVAESSAVQVDGPRINLSDLLSDVSSDVDLGPAPLPGYKRTIDLKFVRSKVATALPSDLPLSWVIETKQQVIDCARLTTELTQALQGQIPQGMTLSNLRCRQGLTLPAGPYQIAAKLNHNQRAAGARAIAMDITVGQWPPRHYVYTADVDGAQQVWVTTTSVTSGQSISTEQLRSEPQQASAVPADAVTDVAELNGLVLQSSLPAGMVLRKSHFKILPMVTTGSFVTISVTLPGVQVSTRGIARQDGKQGDVVSVLCLSTNQLIRGLVVGPKLVSIEP